MGPTLHNLQALRGVACLLVLAFHLMGFERRYGIRTPVVESFVSFGYAGVDLFFVLSGFIITYINARDLGRPAAMPKYLFRRLWRILPTCWLATIVCAGLLAVTLNQPIFEPGWEERWLRYILLLPGDPMNPYVPAWTLTYEMLFYLVFAILILIPSRLGALGLGGWGLAVIGSSITWAPGGNPYVATALSPFVLEFLGGAAVAWIVTQGVSGRGRLLWAAGICYAVIAGLAVQWWSGESWETLPHREHHRVLVFGPASVCIVYGLVASEIRGGYRSPRWLCAIGDASYSIYLTHLSLLPILTIYGCYIPHSRWPHFGWLIGSFLACVAFGFLFYFVVERPLLLLAKGKKRCVRSEVVATATHQPLELVRKAA